MPIAPTYPGVYIEEIPSQVRTIVGVPTSITAFIGRAARGPVDEPVTINSYGDFERIFGGLWLPSSLGYAVRDFFTNGGGQAIVVRLAPGAAAAAITVGALTLEAKYPGTWSNNLRVRIDYETRDPSDTDLFNLTVAEVKLGSDTSKPGDLVNIELHRNVSVDSASARRIDKVLENESRLIRWKGAYPGSDPARPTASDAISASTPLWADNGTSTAGDGTGTPGNASLVANDFTGSGMEGAKTGLYALEKADIFNLLCIPPINLLDGDTPSGLVDSAAAYCARRRAFLIIDPPSTWATKEAAKSGIAAGVGSTSKNAAVFFPRLRQPNPLRDFQIETFAPCGAVAGVFARTDSSRGVWKAPAGQDATLVGVPDLSVPLTDAENGELNPLGVNCLRTLPAAGRVIWGARTRVGDDRLANEWKYTPVRRTALYIEESLYRGTQWAVFEPNDEPLWSSLRLNIGAFMHNLFRQGAFQGREPREAYLVKCDKDTTTQNDINLGIVNIVVGFAPLKPAEFVIIKIQQLAGQIQA